ncbi:MAG TPA: phosphotransferase [Candidatus Angelobacter sp.]|nr:phosphotransferase [Candidatus Angelobacter sp.]
MPDNELLESIRATASGLLGADVVALVPIGGGRNSQVFRVEDSRSRRFALKFYFRHGADNRDRLGTEYSAFAFLRRKGIQQVPEPIASDPARGCAIYQFVEGGRVIETGVQDRDVQASSEFLGRLRDLALNQESRGFGPASEACFSGKTIEESISKRRERLAKIEGGAGAVAAANSFLARQLVPATEQMLGWSRERFRASGLDWDREVDTSERTLSPSDFGFHNALRRPDGTIVFLDFEYFGWDDPAKMISDFLLHPAMDLSFEQRRLFFAAILGRFSGNRSLTGRVEAVYPLFGLKWCFILLNEFLSDEFKRREFAGGAELDRDALQMKQLSKAKRMLTRIRNEYERFPYSG